MSPIRTSRAGLAGCPFDCIRPSSEALAASARVLKNLAAQSHLSIRTELIIHFPTSAPRLDIFQANRCAYILGHGTDNFSVARELRQHRGMGKNRRFPAWPGVTHPLGILLAWKSG